MNPKISIIVPVYKVEKYLNKCIESILNQTFKDFELILVDDGSPDKCGQICDEYAKKDNRVIVIHKENGGQATARNVALDIARGDYIGFVDSDDWIDCDMYELLYGLCIDNNCDISNCSSRIYFKDKTRVNGGHKLVVHNTQESMEVLLKGDLYDECLWTKLIKRTLLEDIRIPVGIAYEDTAFMYRVVDKAKRVCCIGEAKYNYIKRDDSTMDRAIKDIKIDAVLVYEEMYKFIEEKYPELCDLVILKLANSSLTVMNLIIGQENYKIYKDSYYKVSKILGIHFKRSMKLKDYPIKVKILLLLNKIHPSLYKDAIKIIYRRR